MPRIIKRLPKDAYVVEIEDRQTTRRVILRVSDVERSVQRVAEARDKVVLGFNRQIDECKDIIAAIQNCKLEESVLERGDLAKLGVSGTALDGVIKGRVDLADVMKPRPTPASAPVPTPPPDQPRPKKAK